MVTAINAEQGVKVQSIISYDKYKQYEMERGDPASKNFSST